MFVIMTFSLATVGEQVFSVLDPWYQPIERTSVRSYSSVSFQTAVFRHLYPDLLIKNNVLSRARKTSHDDDDACVQAGDVENPACIPILSRATPTTSAYVIVTAGTSSTWSVLGDLASDVIRPRVGDWMTVLMTTEQYGSRTLWVFSIHPWRRTPWVLGVLGEGSEGLSGRRLAGQSR